MSSDCNDKPSEGFLSFDHPVSPEKLQEVARKELGETESLKEECLQEIKRLIQDHDLACISRDDFLLRFLRHKKFDVQKSFQVLRNYAHRAVSNYEKLSKLNPEIVKKCIFHKIINLLPYRDAQGRKILCTAAGMWNPDICSVEEVELVLSLLLSYVAEDESSQILGVVYLHDLKNLSMGLLVYIIPRLPSIHKCIYECSPIRYPAMHAINTQAIIRVILPLITPLTPKKIRDRIIYHASNEDMHKHLNPSLLPQYIGGSLPEVNDDHLTEVLIDHLQKLKEEHPYFCQQDHEISTRL